MSGAVSASDAIIRSISRSVVLRIHPSRHAIPPPCHPPELRELHFYHSNKAKTDECLVLPPHILNTPKGGAGGMSAVIDAAMASASVARASSGSLTPSSHSRAPAE